MATKAKQQAATKLDLVLSAQRAALAALQITTTLERRESSLAAFKAEHGDPRDFDLWHQLYEDELVRYSDASKQPSTSAASDKDVVKHKPAEEAK